MKQSKMKTYLNRKVKKLQYFDTVLNENYVPFVVETSVGLDRMFLSVLSASFKNELLEDGTSRTVLAKNLSITFSCIPIIL